jgi:hypothetical protein
MTMATLDSSILKQMGENGRKKMELEFGEDLVIQKYIKAILPFKKAS